jgi:hypothetical protein
MAPSLMLVVWATWKGARAFHARYGASWGLRTRRILGAIAVITLILNGALVLRSLWGETWKVNSNFLQSGALLVRHPSTCAILSIRRPVMGMLPWNSAETAPDPAVAFMPTSREQSSLTNRADIPLLWIGEAPHCAGEDDTVLVQPRKPENAWETEFGCELLSTGPLAWVSGNLRAKFLENNWVSAPWYSCPARVIQAFPKQEVRTVIARRMRKLPSLPPFGVSGDEFLKQAWGNLDPVDPANRDATFGDW